MALHTERPLAGYFGVDKLIVSTRTADLYSARDLSRGSGIYLWLLRHPLEIESPAVKRFLQRQSEMKEIKGVVPIEAYGVDSEGMAFCVLPVLDGGSILLDGIEPKEAMRRFFGAVRIVANLHLNKVACGDLSHSSFWLNRHGDVSFIGVMGSFDSEAVSTTMLPPQETMFYLAPEQRAGAGGDFASDVYALGMLGLRLFCGRFPFVSDQGFVSISGDGIEEVLKESESLVPSSIIQILRISLSERPQDRFVNADAMMVEISRHAGQETGIVSRKSVKLYAPSSLGKRAEGGGVNYAEELLLAVKDVFGSRMFKLVALGLVLVLVFGLFIVPRNSKVREVRNSSLEVHKIAGSEEIKEVIDALEESDLSLSKKATYLERLVQSSDPLAHEILVKNALDSAELAERRLTERAILDRAKRLGLYRSVNIVTQWLNSLNASDSIPGEYESILKSLDGSLPTEELSSLLRRAYSAAPSTGLQLASALALDLNKLEEMQPVLAQLVGDSAGEPNSSKYSSLALIFSQKELSRIYADDVIQRRDQLKDGDLQWLLEALAARADLHVRAVADLMIDREVCKEVQCELLRMVRDRAGELPDGILQGMVLAADGKFTPNYLVYVKDWYDVDVDKYLLALLALSSDDVLLEVFDVASGRTINVEPSASLIDWVRKVYWEDRVSFARIVGMLAFDDAISDQKLREEFQVFTKFARDSDLINILVRSGRPKVVSIALDTFGNQIGLANLLNLLKGSSKEVKYKAIEILKNYNDVGALKLIIDAYDGESDEEVKDAYRNAFWFVKEREAKR